MVGMAVGEAMDDVAIRMAVGEVVVGLRVVGAFVVFIGAFVGDFAVLLLWEL